MAILQRWVVGRFPNGSWTSGGKLSDPVYEHCETFVVTAASREKAVKKAQGKFYRQRSKGTKQEKQK